jgi:uncharacterized protein
MARVRPVPDEQSAGYWAAAAEHRLALPRCAHCGTYALPPGPVCPGCLSTEPQYEYAPIDGAGSIRSWTVIHDAFLPGFADEVPFVLVDVELDAQADLRMIGRLLDGVDADLHAGSRVTVDFEDLDSEFAVPAFRLDTTT